MKKKIIFLSMEDVLAAGASDMEKAISDVKEGFSLLHSGRVQNPMKTTLRPITKTHEHHVGLVNALPAYVETADESIFSFKLLGAMPANLEKGIPRATGLIVLFEAETKTPCAVMDAQVISAMRTGAVSSLAAQAFLPDNIESAALVGAGVNMRTQLTGIKLARPSLSKIKVYSRGMSKVEFAEEMSDKLNIEIEPISVCEKAVKDQPLIVTCLPNVDKPVVKDKWVRDKGLTFFNIGCYEAETKILSRMDRVVADMWEQGKHRGVQTHALAVSQGVIPEEKVEDFAPVVVGIKPGRTSAEENIFFNPTGLGFEDAMLAHRVYKQALQNGLGKELVLWSDPKWI